MLIAFSAEVVIDPLPEFNQPEMLFADCELVTDKVHEWLPEADLTSLRVLKGGISAKMFAAEVDDFGAVTVRVLDSAWHSADAASREYKLLRRLHSSGFPSPEPLHLGSDFLILRHLEGRATAAPASPKDFVSTFATTLARIHRLEENLDFLPIQELAFHPRAVPCSELREPEVIRALEAFGPPPGCSPVLRHGDFWPGNLIWKDERLQGVIDWEEACMGPAIADVSVTRLDLLWVLGPAAAEQFTNEYVALNPIDVEFLPYWDLRAALRPMGDLEAWAPAYAALDRPDVSYEEMREGLFEFIDNALAKINPLLR